MEAATRTVNFQILWSGWVVDEKRLIGLQRSGLTHP